VTWDAICAAEAQGLCPCCGVIGGCDCCSPDPSGLAGCNDAPCQDAVCAIDAFCCSIGWDSFCAAWADQLCTCCGGGGGGGCDCCAPDPAGAPGCNDPTCQNTVCGVDPFCCSVAWDSICAGEGNSLCACCGGGGGPLCGNGLIEPGEQCDDGNVQAGDGCGPTCKSEVCGNQIKDLGEECDDGNLVPDDGCAPMCVLECGDGAPNPGEPCDDGNSDAGDGCSTHCTLEVCGNGIKDLGEACDDGNLISGDGCSADCALDGCAPDPEQCDDGNPCTNDDCVLGLCTHGNNALPCSDGNACTTADACHDGECVPGSPLSCDDGNRCTEDTCDPLLACIHAPNTLPCDDGSACTSGDVCSGGACLGGAPVNCDDGNACSLDGCVPATGCYNIVDPCCNAGCNCCKGGDASGCNDDGCEATVCATDPACCSVTWDPTCDELAASLCSCCCIFCGNGIVEPGEQCDDGNPVAGDACNPDCTLQVGCITQNLAPNLVEDGASVACSVGGVTTENRWLRRFDLDGDHGIDGEFCVSAVKYGVETSGGGTGVTVRTYCIGNGVNTPGALNYSDLMLKDSAGVEQQDGSLYFSEIEVGGCCVGAAEDLVVEIAGEDCVGSGTCVGFYLGANDNGQIGPSYISAPDCGIVDAKDLASIGFPGDHVVMTVCGSGGGGGIGAVCGNGLLEPGEQCDDGNTISGDGCSATCEDEGGGGTGCNCCSGGSGVGCDDPACQNAICAIDPFCCSVAWDAICSGEARSLCECCGGPGGGTGGGGCDCCDADPAGAPGCNDTTCQNTVCATDPFCCSVAWDAICAGEGASLCACCGGGGGTGGGGCDCCDADPAGAPGCSDPTCQNTVCATDPFCCSVAWDAVCSNEAVTMCSCCGGGGSECGNGIIDPGERCDDGNTTSGDGCSSTCQFEGCAGDPSQCNDGNPCTDDLCVQGVCAHHDNTDPCNDGSACTTGDVCGGGTCNGGAPPNCDDGNLCTDDTCSSLIGCIHEPNTQPCEDGSACTVGDACGGGTCQGGAPADCNDGNPCTDDGCDPGSGCFGTPNAAPCDDADACTTGDACGGGTCQGGAPLDCDDGDACTADSCAPASGCEHDTICCEEPAPRSKGYYERMCDPASPAQPNMLSEADVECVNDTCDFAGVAAVADLCAVLTSRVDPCARAEAQFMALVLNVCRGQVCVGDPIDAHCTAQGTVGGVLAEADGLLCAASPSAADCAKAACESYEINTGIAINVDTLRVEKTGAGIRLSWEEPLHDPGKSVAAYHVWRRAAGGSWEVAAEVEAGPSPGWIDAAEPSGLQYEVTAFLQPN
jgi:cysteine-rich repeat protein